MSRFVNIRSDELSDLLEHIGECVTDRGGSYRWEMVGRETVFVIIVQPRGTVERQVKIFTSFTEGSDSVRACGKDAIRIISGVILNGTFKPLTGGVKVLRTAPKGWHSSRVEAFLTRLRGSIRRVYKAVASARTCPACGSVMVKRVGGNGIFFGCTSYPKCKHTENS